MFKGQQIVNLGLFIVMIGSFITWLINPAVSVYFYTMVGCAFVFGVMLVIPIGSADMPVVMSLLNSYAGLSSAATGFVLGNNVLIIAGTLDGFSGFILSILMCKAMNRSITNVLFGGFGAAVTAEVSRQRLHARDQVLTMPPCNWLMPATWFLFPDMGWLRRKLSTPAANSPTCWKSAASP